jgi:hypothetical protein
MKQSCARRILNQSHHDKASISYAEVERVDADLKRLRVGVERRTRRRSWKPSRRPRVIR